MDKENINTASVTKVPEPEPLPINSNAYENKPVTRRPPLMTLYQIPSQASSSTGQSDLPKRVFDSKHVTLRPDRQSEESVTCENQSSDLGELYTSEIFLHLLSSEKSIKYLQQPELGEMARTRVINWIMKVHVTESINCSRGMTGRHKNRQYHVALGDPEIVQTAVWYLDSLMNQCIIPEVKLEVIAAAVYWIAQKQCCRDVMSAKKLVTLSCNAFNTRQLVVEEKNIFINLGFNLKPIVPQNFITYLAWWCDCVHFRQIEDAANFMCMSGLMVDKKLCEEYPSVLAGAAVKEAIKLLGKGNLLQVLEISPVYRKIVEKTTTMDSVVLLLRAAVLTIANPLYAYKAPMELFGSPPNRTSLKIVYAIQRAT